MSDVCKHCVHAGCLEVCPTGAIIRTEYDTVVIQADVCNGCRDCIAACPFGVIEINPVSRTAMKCTLCYDRLQNGLEPACAKACPTESIKFGTIEELHGIANERVQQLNAQARDAGQPENAYLYGADDSIVGGLNAFFLLVDKPEVYHLPAQAKLPSKEIPTASALGIGGTLGMAALGAVAFRKRRMDGFRRRARETETARRRDDAVLTRPLAPHGDSEALSFPITPQRKRGRAMTALLAVLSSFHLLVLPCRSPRRRTPGSPDPRIGVGSSSSTSSWAASPAARPSSPVCSISSATASTGA